jgi:nicotinate-nucleotide adenylyltransferase
LIKIKSCAIFGGSFDPIHNGHLHLIDSLSKSHKFDRFVVVPAGDPYQKKCLASPADRLKMVELALAGKSVEVSDCEIRRAGPSYAIDTVKEIESLFHAERYLWIIGSDAFAGIRSWNRFEELIEMVEFLVVIRPGSGEIEAIPGVRFEGFEIGALDVSSTEIRSRVENREDVAHLLPLSVAAYIEEKGLYGAA